jgi:putative addiction module CopG family antidote
MTTRSVILPEPPEAFAEAEVASGAYPDADAVLAAAVGLLQREQRREAAKVERFKTLIQEGLDDLEAGRFEVVDDLGAWFDQIEAELDEASRAA